MSVESVASDLVSMCRQGQFMEAAEKHYHADIVSVEPVASPKMPAEMRGIDAIRAKGAWWAENHDFHGCTVDGPFVGDTGFSAVFELDVTQKSNGQRIQMREAAVYEVQGDKVVREEFFYHVPAQ